VRLTLMDVEAKGAEEVVQGQKEKKKKKASFFLSLVLSLILFVNYCSQMSQLSTGEYFTDDQKGLEKSKKKAEKRYEVKLQKRTVTLTL